MRTTPELITAFDRRGLLSPHDSERLRRLYDNAPAEFAPRVLLKWLVKHERLSEEQANRILAAPAAETAADALLRILGTGENLDIEPVHGADDEDTADDTKDLAPLDDDADKTLRLPPAGSPPFSGSEPFQKPAARGADDKAHATRPATADASDESSESPPGSASTVDLTAEPPDSEEKRSRREGHRRRDQSRRTEKDRESDREKTGKDASGKSRKDGETNSRSDRGDLLADLLAGSSANDPYDPLAVPPAKARRKRLPAAAAWDSPLMLVGGAALVLLILGAAFLLWRIGRQGADELFAAAEELYRKPAYAPAVEKYDQFLKKYPQHASAGVAVVHRGLARVRVVVESGRDWPTALQTAEQVLAEIESRDEFPASRAEFGGTLLEISKAAAEQALESNNPVKTALAERALALAEKYAAADQPGTAQALAVVHQLINTAKRRQSRGMQIESTVAALKDAAARGAFREAEAARKKLSEQFADAHAAVELHPALDALAEAAGKAVRFEKAEVAPILDEIKSPVLGSLTLSDRTAGAAEALKGRVFPLLLRDTLFALDATDGHVLWRRVVGFDFAGEPAIVVGESAQAVIFHDSLRDELVKVAASDGRTAWRHPLPPGGRPWFSVIENRVIVSHESGRVFAVDLATGRSDGYCLLPHPPSARAALDSAGRALLQLTSSGIVYSLALADFQCLQARFIDRDDRGLTDPICVGRYLIVVEPAFGSDKLKAFRIDDEGLNLEERDSLALEGRLLGSPQTTAHRLLVVADTGGNLLAFDFAKADDDGAPLKPVAKGKFSGRTTAGHVALQGSQVWLGTADDLQRWSLGQERGELSIRSTPLRHAESIAQPLPVDQLVIHAWRESGNAYGASVAAFDSATNKMVWKTSFGTPASDGIVFRRGYEKLAAIVERGGDTLAYEFSANLSGDLEIDAPTMRIEHLRPTSPLKVDATTDRAMFSAESTLPLVAGETGSQFLVVLAGDPLSVQTFPLAKGERFSAPPEWHGDNILMPLESGQIRMVSAADGRSAADPFQPQVTLGESVEWSPPDDMSDGSLIVSDRIAGIYKLKLDGRNPPRLASTLDSPLLRPIQAGPVALRSTAYAVDTSNSLTMFSTPDLKVQKTTPLEGTRVWGPVEVGDLVMFQIESGDAYECRAYDGDGGSWKTAFPEAVMLPAANESKSLAAVGEVPATDDSRDIFVACESGRLWRLKGASGKAVAEIRLPPALAAPPVATFQHLFFTTQAGEIVWTAKP